ncbi:transglutaminase superfamily protein [Mucilaginibacter gracilis]|uniref:Transglutaminase superfamily protein n=1 Tax=Mucilaginibacter gracilis TaxID=423350 RepID=A0A495IWI4_9SPHI|nr:DUF3857 and transglutaminase domain-containing protein [Mucilaginibacter gracilis]RKR81107.1 transglutaminase superfamily protein [Mucilaginibacter gracilis]
MYNKLLTIAALILLTGQVYSQSKDVPAELYKASTIPDSLKKDANAVVRYSLTDITVKGPGKMVIKEHSVVTVLNEKAEREAAIVLWYDKKFSSVSSAEMIIYDADGKQIKKYRKGDMYDRSASDGISIITDDRMLGTSHTIVSYPVTVEQISETEQNSYVDLNKWLIQSSEKSVQNSIYHFLVNPAIGFRYKNCNTTIAPKKDVVNNMDSYTWEVKNLKAFKLEEEALDWRVLPSVMFAANSFEYGGMPGDISTWAGYGKWQQALNADVCSLTPAREEEIRQMTAGIKTDKEKAKFLYNYMQKNMRYVSVQLGIGGLKPFAATFVDQKKYGDCKALSNYMTALLKAVHIPSYYAIVRAEANREPADPSFPADPFNHIIVCVPFKNDTTWLECTSSTQPFGKLGTFTENRNALLVTEDGGKLVNTPKSTITDNQFKSEAHLFLQPDGGAKATLKIWATGEYRSMYIGLAQQKIDEQKEFLIRNLNIKQPSVFDLKPAGDKEGVDEVNVEMEYDKFCDIMAGDKQFYRPRLFDLWRLTVPVLEKRKSDYYFEHPMGKTCVTTIDLPAGFEVESLPPNASLKFSYGNYDVTYVYDAAKNQIVNTTKFNLNNYVIPAAKYNEMQQYMDNIAKVQNKKLVIRKKA